MPAYKLYYFPLRARAELARYIFAALDVEYEDIRIPFDEWANNKQKMRFRQMPVLEVDGKQLSQSNAIARYLAKKHGLGGKNEWEVAEADMYTSATEDLIISIVKVYFVKDEKDKAVALKEFKEEKAPNVLQAVEAALAESSKGFLVGNDLTYADLAFLSVFDLAKSMLKADAEEVWSKFPNVLKHSQKIQEIPKIAAWISKRPETDR